MYTVKKSERLNKVAQIITFLSQFLNLQKFFRRAELGDDAAELISSTLNNLRTGITVKVRYYDIDSYTTIVGVVTEVNYPYRRIKVIKSQIAFNDIYSIDILKKDVII